MPSLIGSLEDENPEVRKKVFKALGFYKDSRAVQPLINQLQDNDLWIRLEAVYALGEVKDSQAIIPLLSLLNEYSDLSNAFLQQECVIALRKIGNKSPAVIEDLIRKFNEEYLKAEIIKTLGTFRTSKARDLLLESLEHNDEIIRVLSLKALSRLPITRFKKANKVVDQQINHFINSLKDPAPSVRAASAEVLGNLRDEQAIEPLIEALRDSDQNVKREAIKSLYHYPNHRAFHSIAKVIGCDDNSLKAFAAEQFKKMGKRSQTRKITLRFPHGGSYNLWENTDAVTAILDTIDKADLKGKIELVKLLGA